MKFSLALLRTRRGERAPYDVGKKGEFFRKKCFKAWLLCGVRTHRSLGIDVEKF